MTPASFAKLTIRTISAWGLLVFSPGPVLMVRTTLTATRIDGFSLFIVALLVGLIVALVAAWFAAGWLGRFLLPAKAPRTLSPDFPRWQNMALRLLGGWQLCVSVNALLIMAFAPQYGSGSDLPLLLFRLIAGVLLLVGLPYRKRQSD